MIVYSRGPTVWLLGGLMLWCVSFFAASLCASQASDELDRYQKAEDKVNSTYEEGVARERTRTLSNLSSAIKRLPKGDKENADALWKLVLQLDVQNEGARDYFTATGKLAAVLTELAAHQGPLLGDGNVTVVKKSEPVIDMSDAKLLRVTASVDTGYTLGSFKKGTVLVFQYVSGAWSGDNRKNEAAKNQSPDAADTADDNRMEIFVDSGNQPRVLVAIPAGTAAKPFVYTIEEDLVGVSIRIVNRKGIIQVGLGRDGKPQAQSTYAGEVKYLVRIVR